MSNNLTAPLDAGHYGAWLASLRRGADADVACDGCTACCRAGYFIHVEPDETDALAAIPEALLFAAPGLPPGHRIMGHNARGHCPMLVDNRCSIYASRPRTCRRFDCRVFAATHTVPDEPAAAAVAQQVVRWTFRQDTQAERLEHAAAADAAAFLARHANRFDRGVLPPTSTQRALLAVRLHTLFMPDQAGARASADDAADAAVDAAVQAISATLAAISAR